MEIIKRGAEAEIYLADWRGREVIVKRRIKKGYRIKELDERIREQRTKREALLMMTARKAGVSVPIIYDVRIKDKRIKEVSREIKEKYGGLDWIYKMDIKDAKKELKKLKGVGDKTADVIISSIYGSKNAFVVDTHMRRIAIRLGIVDEKATYEEIQNALIKLFPWDSIKNEERTLSLFWLMAKHICNAKKPKCNECIFKENCKWYKKL